MLSALNEQIELLDAQVKENVAIIPIKTPINYKFDILTLKKGFELGLAEVKECEHSTVNTLIVKNNSITPLLLVDGEEIVGGDQNRIVSETILVAPQSEIKVPVNCTEQGRWRYEREFVHSEYMANSKTRFAKAASRHSGHNMQREVWKSIHDLENSRNFLSETHAMSESYENIKSELDVSEFEVIDGQTGVLVIIDGEIKGFELFFNSQIYSEYHEKIIKSYLIDAEINDSIFAINIDEAKSYIATAIDSDFREIPKTGLETSYEFKNPDGIGTVTSYEDEIIHLSYFSKKEDESGVENENTKEDIDIIV
ncbi:ARPP-1 family domain-containing protein [uncultured Methanobrevibacter sp.]|uniref:ARPP-1 family domain-containing protein n=1 Tax=uncultured Methanobrevibacter sp. TaxID=253161 RepID=UPI002628363F|nr:DUF6569 family protein [uncultured Methanobrevibacter sp.]